MKLQMMFILQTAQTGCKTTGKYEYIPVKMNIHDGLINNSTPLKISLFVTKNYLIMLIYLLFYSLFQ